MNKNQELTEQQKSTSWETLKHIERVMCYLATFQEEIIKRMFSHDRSKLNSPELEMFEKFTHKLSKLTYGSPEYEECRQQMLGQALQHHYENNRHHPEFFKNGIEDMNLIDVLEMLCDWKAAGERHEDGDILESIEINTKRFNLSPQLVKILQNTVPLLQTKYSQNSQKNL